MKKRQAVYGWRYAAVAVAALGLSACAGGFSKDLTRTQISTVPAGATCALGGSGFAQIVKTPATIILPKESSPIRVSCEAAGHRTFVATVKPVFNERILNNFLLGSSLGVVVDMMNGHDTKYPERIHMNLEPTSFVSTAARDAWFSRYKDHVAGKWDRALVELRENCNESSNEDGDCMLDVKSAEARKTHALAVLEHQRRRAHVRTSATAGEMFAPPAIQ